MEQKPIDVKTEIVSAAALVPENSVRVRFSAVTGSKSAKAPKFRVALSLGAALAGLVLEAPIFQDAKDGSYSVGLPGGSFAALKAEPKTMTHDGKLYILADTDPLGAAKLDQWSPQIMTAFHMFLTTGKTEQRIIFG